MHVSRRSNTVCITTNTRGPLLLSVLSQGKSDLILSTVQRMERMLDSMVCQRPPPCPQIIFDLLLQVSDSRSKTLAAPSVTAISPLEIGTMDSNYSDHSDAGSRHHRTSSSHVNVFNAILAPLHTSATESVLKWPNFANFPELRSLEGVSVFQLEQNRSPVPEKLTVTYPYVSPDTVAAIIDAFQQNINFWYPTLSQEKIDSLKTTIISGDLDQSCHSCLALLLMALGCVCDWIAPLFKGGDVDLLATEFHQQRRKMAESYFDGAMKRLHTAGFEISIDAAECSLLASYGNTSTSMLLLTDSQFLFCLFAKTFASLVSVQRYSNEMSSTTILHALKCRPKGYRMYQKNFLVMLHRGKVRTVFESLHGP